MISPIQHIYTTRVTAFNEQLKKIEGTIKTISYSRLTIALAVFILFYFSLTQNTNLFYLVLIFSIFFTILAVIHSQLFRKRNILQNYILINENEIAYLKHNFSSFNDGKEFIDFNHPYTYDLDIFGEGSLYQSINRTTTLNGKSFLADALSKPSLSHKDIVSKQECIKELNSKLDFRQKFQAVGLLLQETESDRNKLNNWLSENFVFLHKKYILYIIYLFPILTIASLIISIVDLEVHPSLSICILSGWILYGFNAKNINKIHSTISKKKLLLENYSELFKIVEEENFQTSELNELRTSLNNASHQFKKLAKYVGWLDQRLNIVISPILNTLFLYDLQICYRIEQWREENDSKVLSWFNNLGKKDYLNSLSNFSYNNPDFCFPELSQETLYLNIKGISHPLIKRDKRITNNIELGDTNHIALITGANMAGKSTFLRTVGTNLVLGYTGAPVCAISFKTSLLDIVSSMRISDSLKEDISYFYAELQRLKTIKQKAESGNPTLIMLDEMLRGTNSNDKQQGSKQFVENLIKYNCLTFVATHDLLLGKLEEEYPSKIKNYSFESFLKEDKLVFDYKIREGVAQNTNASFLMKSLGII